MRRLRAGVAGEMLSEFLGTFVLVLLGCGSVAVAVVGLAGSGRQEDAFGPANWLIISWGWGLGVVFGVYVAGKISGGHINPAVTLAFTLTRHFPARDAGAYVAGQIVGAVAAALTLLAIWPDAPASLGATAPSGGAGSALVYELVMTALLMFVIMAVATDTRAVGAGAAIAIGGAVGLAALFGGPVTGASMNPARSLGPALAAVEWADFWVYVVGPCVGAALGAVAYQAVRGESQAHLSEPA